DHGQMMRMTTDSALPSPKSGTIPAGGCFRSPNLTCTRPSYAVNLTWNRVWNSRPSGPDAKRRPPRLIRSGIKRQHNPKPEIGN
ncbi:hypothetical protein AVEN_62761-1, partial [Araneus ventricosus]